MSWHVFRVTAPPEILDAISGILPDLGSTGAVEGNGELRAYFPPDGPSPDEIRTFLLAALSRLEKAGLQVGDVVLAYEQIPDRDWNEAWKKQIVPLKLECGVTIVPSWQDDVSEDKALRIVVDPGSAFGTGHHETTADCLCSMMKYAAAAWKASPVLADLGTGTGVLALLGARIGFLPVYAIDHDPEAVSAALRNRHLNELQDRVQVTRGSIDDVPEHCGMITANLFAGPLVDYLPDLVSRLAKGGILILSGMLEGQELPILGLMEPLGLDLRERICRERWVTLVGTKL